MLGESSGRGTVKQQQAESDTVPPGNTGCRARRWDHITRGLEAKPRNLNFILRETGSCGSKSPHDAVELGEWRPVGTGDIASFAAKLPAI